MAAADKVKVAVRLRPFNERERQLGTGRVVNISPGQTSLTTKSGEPKLFSFDACFDSTEPASPGHADQQAVFDALGTDILENAFKGYNACIFAYGQTGSGKSYTMMGSSAEPGIIPRLCSKLFQRIEETTTTDSRATAEVSYMEIYNEKATSSYHLILTKQLFFISFKFPIL